jgi:hypothetical protein
MAMRSEAEVRTAFRLAELGLSRAEIARRIGISRATVRDWLDHGEAAVLARPMRTGSARRRPPHERCVGRCEHSADLGAAYAYLMGQFLGDGCITTTETNHRFRLFCCDDYPGIMQECRSAIEAVHPAARIGSIARTGCTEIHAIWPHWPCLFPHGPGAKHSRAIVLEPWQREIVLDDHPERFVRGLIHSDGCRCINRVTVRGRRYEYVRYFFSNRSRDIQALFLEVCERLGVEARSNNAWSISVARREAVAKLDAIIGPKS